MNQLYRNMLTLAMAMLVLLAIVSIFRPTPEPTDELTYSEFLAQLEGGKVAEVEIRGEDIEGSFQSGQSFRSRGPAGDAHLQELLRSKGVRTVYKPRDEGGFWNGALMMWLPMLIFIGLWFLLFLSCSPAAARP